MTSPELQVAILEDEVKYLEYQLKLMWSHTHEQREARRTIKTKILNLNQEIERIIINL